MTTWGIKQFFCFGVGVQLCLTPLFASDFYLKPPTQTIIDAKKIPFSGQLRKGKIWINGSPIQQSWSGKFRQHIPCHVGKNTIWLRLKTEKGESEFNRSYYCLEQFEDIGGHWAKKEIQQLSTVFGISGRGGTAFYKPNAPITRQELAYILVSVKNDALIKPETPSYTDIHTTDWAYPYIETAYKNHYIEGTSPKHFSPRGFVTRAECAKILITFSGTALLSRPIIKAKDLSASFWGKDYIHTMARVGVWPESWTKGPYFYPYRPVTRGEMAVIMMRLPKSKKKVTAFFNMRVEEKKVGKGESSILKSPKWQRQDRAPFIEESWATIYSDEAGERLRVFIKLKEGTDVAQVKINLLPFKHTRDYELRNDGAGGDQKRRDAIFTGEWPIEEGFNAKTCWVSLVSKEGFIKKEKIRLERPQKELAEDVFLYTVKKGDTLPKITRLYTGSSKGWLTIATLNNLKTKDVITKTGKHIIRCDIFAGKTLKLPRSWQK